MSQDEVRPLSDALWRAINRLYGPAYGFNLTQYDVSDIVSITSSLTPYIGESTGDKLILFIDELKGLDRRLGYVGRDSDNARRMDAFRKLLTSNVIASKLTRLTVRYRDDIHAIADTADTFIIGGAIQDVKRVNADVFAAYRLGLLMVANGMYRPAGADITRVYADLTRILNIAADIYKAMAYRLDGRTAKGQEAINDSLVTLSYARYVVDMFDGIDFTSPKPTPFTSAIINCRRAIDAKRAQLFQAKGYIPGGNQAQWRSGYHRAASSALGYLGAGANWVKNNPGKSAALVGGALVAAYFATRGIVPVADAAITPALTAGTTAPIIPPSPVIATAPSPVVQPTSPIPAGAFSVQERGLAADYGMGSSIQGSNIAPTSPIPPLAPTSFGVQARGLTTDYGIESFTRGSHVTPPASIPVVTPQQISPVPSAFQQVSPPPILPVSQQISTPRILPPSREIPPLMSPIGRPFMSFASPPVTAMPITAPVTTSLLSNPYAIGGGAAALALGTIGAASLINRNAGPPAAVTYTSPLSRQAVPPGIKAAHITHRHAPVERTRTPSIVAPIIPPRPAPTLPTPRHVAKTSASGRSSTRKRTPPSTTKKRRSPVAAAQYRRRSPTASRTTSTRKRRGR